MLIYDVIKAFDQAQIKYAVVGGYALALHGIVRATVDIDFVLNLRLSDFEKAEKALREIGLQSRLPIRAADIIKMREEYIQNRNLLAWSFVDYKSPSRQVDILINKNLKNIKTTKISVGGLKITVVNLKELRKMKLESGRDQDLIDVRMIDEKLDKKA